MLNQSQELAPPRKRVDGATVFKRFTKAIKDNGGDEEAYQQAVVVETQELFGCNLDTLYRETGGKRRRRDTLPQPAQEAYMVNESLTANELERSVGGLSGETQQEVNGQIVGIVREQSKKTKRWLPW
ncbi:MAG: hypothetical protein AAFY78_22880 [Cyanobacteria bacterium J06648_16]